MSPKSSKDMSELLKDFEPQLVEDISQLFESPQDYWDAVRSWRQRELHGGQYDPRLDLLREMNTDN